ncbi:MAG: (4Fe-4S)-binding protein [Bacteroidia bacterium]|jgi:MinD superfamily P-loop ATPase|nr:(4Fe-4S)-binding protein [Bacteroidia bacterium]
MKNFSEIVVLSGKGGTGKTSVAASLAFVAGNDAVLADCDVDAANLHLVMAPDYYSSEQFFGGELAIIDSGNCISCGLCMDICRFDAVTRNQKSFHIDNLKCEGCGYCYHLCPAKAISMVPRKSGEVYLSNIKNGSKMAHARLSVGGENSGKLVAKVKSEAKKLAIEQGCSYIIVDGAPGIGCPVVASVSGATVALLITEPTMSALHDLKRVMFVIKRFRVKPLLIINKFDINLQISQEIKDYSSVEGIIHVADIPYNTFFTQSIGRAKIVAEEYPEIASLFRSIWESVKVNSVNC